MTSKASKKFWHTDDLKSAAAAEQRRQDIERMLSENKSPTLIQAKLGATTREIELARRRMRAADKAKATRP